VAEEWAFITAILRLIRLLKVSLIQIQAHGHPSIPGPIKYGPDHQVIAQVFPASISDRLLLPGTTAEVWMQPGVRLENLSDSQAGFYRKRPQTGKLVLVLGAGNVSMLVPSDCLYKLFVEGHVVLLKLNPVNSYLESVLEKGFQALIERGFLRIVQGGSETGAYLCYHPGVDEIHTTGSDKTYEDIIFGPGQEGAQRRAKREPLLTKRFTAELGNVTPVIIVPGQWSEDEVQAQAERLARWLVINSGFNCLTPRVIIQWSNWPQRKALNQAIGEVLETVPTRKAYYPRAEERFHRYLSAHPQAQMHPAKSKPGHLPWAFITDLDPHDKDDICFRNEPFCSLFSETSILADSPEEFIQKAVDFSNHTLWGNLTATMVVQPRSLIDRRLAASVQNAIARLNYGMVLLNQFAGIGFMALTTTWGAFPGNDIYDIQSGIGVTSNLLMFEQPQKSVVRSPFQLSTDPFAIHSRTATEFTRELAKFQYKPTVRSALKLTWFALRS
jgi:hypothetical protein